MADPRVSVLVPVHNAGPFLAEALESVLAQSYPSWEAIVVDDASSDGSVEVARSYAARDPRVRAVPLPANVGVAAARNAGAAVARGSLLALLDQDDRWLPSYLSRCVAAFDAAGPRVAVVACDAQLWQDGRPLGETYFDRFGRVSRVDLDVMMERNAVHARALVSREAFEAVGGFDPACLASDDFDLWMRLLEAGWSVETVPEALTVFRLHDASQSRDQRRMSEGTIAAYSRSIARGALTPGQRAAARRRVRHHRALLARERVRSAQGPLAVAASVSRAAPLGLVAFLQAPSRWGEWLGGTPSARRPS
jgi:glycosyltransferase involved in cell wall biosynthesis